MNKPKSFDGHGGSFTVGDTDVKRAGGTLNPGDPGYTEAVRKVPIEQRAATFRDLEHKPPKPPQAEKPAGSNNQGGKR